MAIEINEFVGNDFFSKTIESAKALDGVNVTEASNTQSINQNIDPDSLMVEIEAIHAYPHATRNFTRYMPKGLKNSVPSWTNPYNRPLIKHHNEENGKIIGRVLEAKYIENKTFSGTPALLFTVNIPDKEAKTAVLNGTESTVSIGVTAHDVRCSICGEQLATMENPNEHDHERGKIYNNEICYWDMYSITPKEVSYVVVPSDIYAKNRRCYSATSRGDNVKQAEIKESYDISNSEGDIQMADNNTAEPQVDNQTSPTGLDLAATEAALNNLMLQVKESANEIADIKSVRQALERRISNLEESEKYYRTEADTAKVTREALEAKIAELKKELEGSKKEISEAATLREGLETALEEAKIAAKNSMIEAAQAYRMALGRKVYSDEDIQNRSDEAILCAIKDMKEEMTHISSAAIETKENADIDESKKEPSVADLPKITSPEIVESAEDDEKAKKLKEETTKLRNVDLEEGLSKLFGGIAFR